MNNAGLFYFRRVYQKDILRQHDYIGQLPDLERTFALLAKLCIGGRNRVSANCFFDCYSLFRYSTVLAIDYLARHRRVNSQNRR